MDEAKVKFFAEGYIIPSFLYTRFDERATKQMEFSRVYANSFHHGADGHNNMMIISGLLDVIGEISSSNAKQTLEIMRQEETIKGFAETLKKFQK